MLGIRKNNPIRAKQQPVPRIMRAAAIDRYGGPKVLTLQSRFSG